MISENDWFCEGAHKVLRVWISELTVTEKDGTALGDSVAYEYPEWESDFTWMVSGNCIVGEMVRPEKMIRF